MTRLVLGTAQFGAGYGAMNTSGRLSDATVREVCTSALEGGVEIFDSSPYYGDAQQRLGDLVSPFERPKFVSKFGLGDEGAPGLDEILTRTLHNLKVDHLEGLLFHRVQDLRDQRAAEVSALVREARAEGLVKGMGASVYELSDLEAALAMAPDLDIVQLPGSVVDRRLLDHPLLAEFHDQGGTVHVRSAYLQGVLLASPEDVPEKLSELRPVMTELRETAESCGASLIELLLGFLKHHPLVDAVVIGALSAKEMRETLTAWDRAPEVKAAGPVLDEKLLDPRRW